jgi:hypothetical protein
VTDVAVWILHPEPAATAGPLERLLSDARRALAERHRTAFLAAGAATATVVSGPADDTPFGARLRDLEAASGAPGVVVLGSGAIPLATAADRRDFVSAAGSGGARTLANNRYSADVVAIACAERLLQLPDLAADNALPRWLEEAGYEVRDLRRRWRLAMDLDSPLDLALLGDRGAALDAVTGRLDAFAAVAHDRRAEIVVAGRTNAASIAWLERHAAARVRALVEERGLRASGRVTRPEAGSARAPQRPPRSVLGLVLDRDGPDALGDRLAELGDAALVDTRVLLAHRLGPDESRWPSAEDRFASDLLAPDGIADPWLRRLTESAAAASIPIVLGGHSLVGPGVRLAARRSPR